LYTNRLTNHYLAILGEVVLRNLKVKRGGSLSYTARDVVVGTMAGAEPAAEVTSLTDRDTTKVGADACDYVSSMFARAEVEVPSMINHSGFLTRSESD